MIQLFIVILITLLFSAFFSASEYAFISSNKLLLELESRKKTITAKLITKFYTDPKLLVSSMLMGNVICLVIYSVYTYQLTNLLLADIMIDDLWIILIQIAVAASCFLLVGMFIPKIIARINPNRFIFICIIPVYIAYAILYPLFLIVNLVSLGILKIFGIKSKNIGENIFKKEDIDYFIQKSIEEGQEGKDMDQEIKFFQNAIDFSSMKIRDCMIPRTEIIAVSIDTTEKDLISLFVESGYSKLIVYEEDLDNIVGYIHSSELFSQRDNWTKSIVPLLFVPENMAANKLMKDMLNNKKSMAVIVDEFGGTAGIITLEDLVEEIFGEIEDEHDHDTKKIIDKQLSELEFVLSGRVEIDSINEKYDLNIPESDDYMTIAGYILNHYQNLPKINEIITIDNYQFRILKVSHTKIELVRMKVL